MTTTTKFLFYTLLVISFFIEKTYEFGVFYRNNLHDYVVEYSKKALALSIVTLSYTRDGLVYVYNNRQQYITQANNLRNQLGEYFVYRYNYA